MYYKNFEKYPVREIQCIENEPTNISPSENINNELSSSDFLNFNFINNKQPTRNNNLICTVYNND